MERKDGKDTKKKRIMASLCYYVRHFDFWLANKFQSSVNKNAQVTKTPAFFPLTVTLCASKD